MLKCCWRQRDRRVGAWTCLTIPDNVDSGWVIVNTYEKTREGDALLRNFKYMSLLLTIPRQAFQSSGASLACSWSEEMESKEV